ncbi:hypothetical protein ACFL2C_04050, partial [Patescibacteria group bacterium]
IEENKAIGVLENKGQVVWERSDTLHQIGDISVSILPITGKSIKPREKGIALIEIIDGELLQSDKLALVSDK